MAMTEQQEADVAALDAEIQALESQLATYDQQRQQLLADAKQKRRELNDKLTEKESILQSASTGPDDRRVKAEGRLVR